jgi:hypothetical protein
MAGWLDEGLRGEICGGGIKAWSEDLAWHPEVGGRAARGGRRRREEVATVSRRGEGDEADRQAPHGSDVREREDVSAGVRKAEENTAFGNLRQRGLGRVDRAGIQWPVGIAGRRGRGWAKF